MIIMQNPDVEQFKRDLMSYNYHIKKAEELKLQIYEINYRMSGAGTIPMQKIAPTVSHKYRSNAALIMQKDYLFKQMDDHSKNVAYVDSVLCLMNNKDRMMVEQKYIEHMHTILREHEWNYSSRQINRMCNVFDPCHFQQ